MRTQTPNFHKEEKPMVHRENIAYLDKDTMSLEDLFCLTYCTIDEYYTLLFGEQSTFRRSPNGNPAFTDAEVITIALVGELKSYNSERAWWRFVHKNYRYLFPHLCSRTRYGRRLRRLKLAIERIRQQFLFQLDVNCDRTRLVDSFPLRLLRLPRLSGSSCPFEYAANVGYCASLKEWYYGFKMHILTDVRGIPVAFVLTPASPHDSQGLPHLLEELIELGLHHLTLIVVGDKAYIGEDYARRLKETYGIDLLAIQKHPDKDLPETGLNELLKKTRKIIETTNSVLTQTLNANWTYCRSVQGLLTKLVGKLTACNLANYFNSLMGLPLLEVKEFAN
jgi:hypothetical protein